MSVPFQIAIDCADPHALVRFWAAAMDLEVEDHSAFVQRMLDERQATSGDTAVVDGRLAWREAAACRGDEPGQPRLLFQAVPEPKAAKNRVHLDLHVGAEARDAKVADLIERGATRIGEGAQGPFAWIVLADPQGNEFCVA